MLVAIDYDGTLKSSSQISKDECKMWGHILHAFWHFGHEVIICTMREGHPQDMRELEEYLVTLASVAPPEVPTPKVVFCGSRGLKREVCKMDGYLVDIWIDDMPGMIEKTYLLPVLEDLD